MILTEMDYVRAALSNAFFERLTVEDLNEVAAHASNAIEFDYAVNELIQATGNVEADLRDAYREFFPK